MNIKRFNEFPENSGTISSDDVFLFMDDPSGESVTKKISLSDLANAIGVISNEINTGDIVFSGSTISTMNTNQIVGRLREASLCQRGLIGQRHAVGYDTTGYVISCSDHAPTPADAILLEY